MRKIFAFLLLIAVFSLCVLSVSFAQEKSIVGKWKTIDDETNEPKSIVQIYEKDGLYFGQITELFRKPGEDPDPVCDKCPKDDVRKDQPIKGMVILKDLVQDGDKYKDGTILDPKKGKIYNCKVWIEGGELKLRGYIAFLFRTQTWLRVE
ncbi:MAG: DUF2147 domain-containing protein [Desulfobacterium sp.]|nr:DUF2147 domain-containing protein [Desulfobacterium sp.]